ncbi:phosphoglycerate kinase, partial [bacterium]|nr:phosphoglycerate kinase [bacterium]
IKTLKDFEVSGKKVLVRCDFNVPLSETGEILDDFRIKKTLPTIEYLQEKGAKTILISHLGRPQKEISNLKSQISNLKKYSLKPVAKRLGELLKVKVKFLSDCIGPNVKAEIEKMKERDVVLLENLRFYREEKKGDEEFAKKLSDLASLYINDAFASCHRDHASISKIPKFLESGAGFLLLEEVRVLSQIIENPEKPLVAIFGGREADIKAMERLSGLADFILTNCLVAREIKEKNIAFQKREKIIFPFQVESDKDSFDIGPKTVSLFKEKIKRAKTVFWSGPLGKIEEKRYQRGSKEIAKAILESGAFSVVGGGDTIKFLKEIKLRDKFSHICTGGSAMLRFLSGEELPGIEALKYARD